MDAVLVARLERIAYLVTGTMNCHLMEVPYLKPECEVNDLRTEAPLLTGSHEGWGEEGLFDA